MTTSRNLSATRSRSPASKTIEKKRKSLRQISALLKRSAKKTRRAPADDARACEEAQETQEREAKRLLQTKIPDVRPSPQIPWSKDGMDNTYHEVKALMINPVIITPVPRRSPRLHDVVLDLNESPRTPRPWGPGHRRSRSSGSSSGVDLSISSGLSRRPSMNSLKSPEVLDTTIATPSPTSVDSPPSTVLRNSAFGVHSKFWMCRQQESGLKLDLTDDDGKHPANGLYSPDDPSPDGAQRSGSSAKRSHRPSPVRPMASSDSTDSLGRAAPPASAGSCASSAGKRKTPPGGKRPTPEREGLRELTNMDPSTAAVDGLRDFGLALPNMEASHSAKAKRSTHIVIV